MSNKPIYDDEYTWAEWCKANGAPPPGDLGSELLKGDKTIERGDGRTARRWSGDKPSSSGGKSPHSDNVKDNRADERQ